MNLKHRTQEKWMKRGFLILFIVGVTCTLVIVLSSLK
jgi:hypothetical protein